MFYSRCSLIRQINAIILDQGTMTDSLSVKVMGTTVITLQYICCIETVIDLCVSCILTTFNKDDDDDNVDIRSTDITREQFKRSLKIWLYECAYGRRRV